MAAVCLPGPLAAGLSFLDPRVLAYTAAIAGSLLLGAIILALVDRWRKKQMNDTRSVQDELVAYRALYQRGELSAEEYQRVRTRLVDQLKAKPKPIIVRDPETGMPIELKNPTEPVVPKAPEAPKEPDAPPPPPPGPPTS